MWVKCESVIIEDIEESRVAISITKGSGSKLKKGRAKRSADDLEKRLCLLNDIAYNSDDEHEDEATEGGQGSGDEAENGPLNADDEGDETEEGHEAEEVNEGTVVETNKVNAEDDITDNEFVDSDYSLEDDDRRVVDDTTVESVVGDTERGERVTERDERVGNQHPKDVIDARDVEDVPLDDERQDSDGLHNVDDSGSECDEKVNYPEFNEEADRDDPKFEKGLKFRDAAHLREAVWSHSIKHDAPFIKLNRNEKWKISARCEKNCP
ncbi:U3 small nucleolar RNA-associated protein 18-like [Malus sylvestris]|uniref:U3 small nucleolar RNA-associated protein 18-like n=1 Tax=Malus sylvestris TaxID=3752 RepID=UPI0021AC0606|nr:U3 small nucleolar RNA-associated protein 18-like [Malus sylvestris]